MRKILFTFLGRVPKAEGGYRAVRYRFPDGEETLPVAFFGWPLVQRTCPDLLVVLGTPGSMWDHLFEADFTFGSEAVEDQLALGEAVERSAVTAGHLDALAPLLGARLGCEVRLDLIPYCRDEIEQVQVLQVIARHVGGDDIVDLDVTHGFRHLPMLSLLAALYLRRVRGARIGHIWYGAFDPSSGEATVHDLAGLLRIANWLDALAVYDHSGDYGVFAPLAGGGGDLLAKAAYFERTTNTLKARAALNGWASRAERLPAGQPEVALFADALEERLAWYRLADRAQWEAALARRYLADGDYLRAAIFGQEAVKSAWAVRTDRDVRDSQQRDGAHKELLCAKKQYATLSEVRNALAHGVRPADKRITRIIAHEDNLNSTLQSLFRSLLPHAGGKQVPP
ncbi:MAG: TIGR02221 family CRISPR-associated protein [Gammaproteobacteria bacterium]|nr:TIGR02221 family CRISPR-associated protein [Gammaproteobacteria bacterium]